MVHVWIIGVHVTQDMSTHNVPDTFANDDTIVDYVGGGADQQAEQVRTITNHRTSRVHEV